MQSEPTDHGHLFKELLTTFFFEFLELFFPDLAASLDRDFGFIPMNQEIHTDMALEESRAVDLLMRVEFRGEDAFFLIHVENQATAQGGFPRRMYRYFANLTLRHDLPIYPIVLFSYDAPQRAEPHRFEARFPDWDVLRFQYRVIQLNRIPWRRFLKSDNPVANALMAKMKIAPRDRPKARAQLLRLLATSKRDPARTTLIGLFIDRYLKLTAEETKVFDREMSRFAPAERETAMELVTSWQLQGREEGRQEGKEEIVLRLVRKRFGIITEGVAARISRLTSVQLSDLGEDLLDFSTLSDLEQWLTRLDRSDSSLQI